MNERINISCREWRKLRFIGWLTRAYVETITILLAIEWLEPKGLLQQTTLVIVFFVVLRKITGAVATKIKRHYAIVIPENAAAN